MTRIFFPVAETTHYTRGAIYFDCTPQGEYDYMPWWKMFVNAVL